MNVSLKYLQDCSSRTGYRIDALEKVVRLGQMAADVARHPFLGSVLSQNGFWPSSNHRKYFPATPQ